MYEYVDDKQFIMSMRSYCGDLMQDLCHTLKEERDIGAMFYLIGSGERNMIAINEYVSAFNLGNSRFDLDYNLEIVRIDDWEDCEYIKECVRNKPELLIYDFEKTVNDFGENGRTSISNSLINW